MFSHRQGNQKLARLGSDLQMISCREKKTGRSFKMDHVTFHGGNFQSDVFIKTCPCWRPVLVPNEVRWVDHVQYM